MFKKILPGGVSAIVIGLGLGLAVIATMPAQARDYGSHKGPIIKQGHGKGHASSRHYGHRPYARHRTCSPREAVHKAQRIGVHRARVEGVGRRFVIVKGRGHRGKILMAFHRKSPHCSVAWVKRGKRHGHQYRY